MKPFVILLCVLLCGCVSATSQVPPAPTNLRLGTAPVVPTDPSIIPVPILSTNGGFQAWFKWPEGTTNIWMPEISNNGTDWMWSMEWAQIPERSLRVSGVKLNLPRMVVVQGPNWQVRLRRVFVPPNFPWIPIPY